MQARILNCTYDQYLKDDIGADVPTLNSSVARVIEQKSAAHGFVKHPKLNPELPDAKPKNPAKCLDRGSSAHTLLLNAGKEIRIVDADDWRTKKAREDRDALRMAGFIPLLQKEKDALDRGIPIIQEKIRNAGIRLDQTKNELMIHFESDGVQCRRALDAWDESNRIIYDLKSITCAHPDFCEKRANDLDYDIEFAASMDAIYKLYNEDEAILGRVKFIFIFIELEPPYAVTPLPVGGAFAAAGYQRWSNAKAKWRQALLTGEWPGYDYHMREIGVPAWKEKRIFEDEI